MKTYGMPYKGSKSRIAQQIINILPEAEYFVDLFGGGGAMIDCAMHSIKYQKGIYNELETLAYKGFCTGIQGGYHKEKRWISRDDFFKLRESDPYVAICFSFSNDLKTYCYSKELEAWKKALHYARVCGDTSELAKFGIISDGSRRDIVKHKDEYKAKYLEWLKEDVVLPDEFERLQSLERLETYNLSYEQVPIPDNAVIYCDIPYKATNTYLSSFDYEAFYTWCREQKQDVFISEYAMPDDFYMVTEFDRVSLMSPNSREPIKERLYCNHEYKIDEQLTLW